MGPIGLAAPVAEPRPRRRQFSGVTIEDSYAWLENPRDPEVIAHLEAENAYTNALMAGTEALRETLYQEIVGRVQRTDTQVPFRLGDVFYYTRTEEGKDYDIICRKRGGLEAPEEILLDLNEIAGDYLALGQYAPSNDHRYLAYATNETGGLAYTLYVKDLETGELLPERLPNDGYGFAWAADNRTLFYSRQDAALRSCELWRHELGTDVTSDALLYREDDPTFSVSVFASDSKAFIILHSGSFETSEVRYLRAGDPTGDFTLVARRRPGVQYSLEHAGDDFLVLTNEDAVNFKLLAIPVADPRWERQRELIPHRERALLQDMDVFERQVLVSGREDGQSRLWVHDLDSGATRPLEFDEPIHTVRVGDNRELHTTKAVIVYTSFVTPPSFYEIDLVSGERTLLKQEPVVVAALEVALANQNNLNCKSGARGRPPHTCARGRDRRSCRLVYSSVLNRFRKG